MTAWERSPRVRDPARGVPPPADRSAGPPLAARAILRLQASAGNAAVGRMIGGGRGAPPGPTAQRLGTAGPVTGPPPPPARVAGEDRGFRAVSGQLGSAKRAFTAHPPASR